MRRLARRRGEGSTGELAGEVLDVADARGSFDNAIVSTPSSAKYCVYSRDCCSKSSSSFAVESAFMVLVLDVLGRSGLGGATRAA